MTVNHGVLGSSPCSGAIAQGLQKRFFNDVPQSGKRVNEVSVDSNFVEERRVGSPEPFLEKGV